MYYIYDYHNKEDNCFMNFVKNKIEDEFRKRVLEKVRKESGDNINHNKNSILKVDTLKEAEELRKKLKY